MCVCLSASLCVKDSCWKRQSAHEDVQQECLPAPGTSSKTRRWGQKEKKDMKARRGGWRRVEVCVRRHMACVEGQMFVVQGGKGEHACTHIHTHPVASAIAVPPWDKHRCVEWRRQHAGTLTTYTTFLQQYSLFSLTPISAVISPRHLVPMVHSEF